MYWLRRIPAETRIVVLVIFLALLQAILLSVFGLGAIRNERRNVSDQLELSALSFLRVDLAARVRNGLRDRADEVLRVAFEAGDPDWRDREPPLAGGLFAGAWLVSADGAVFSPDGYRQLPSPVRPNPDESEGRDRARELSERHARGELDEPAQRLRADLEFARQYPFLRDDYGRSLSLLFAASPLLSGDGPPDTDTLLAVRWIGVLNRFTRAAAAEEVAEYLARVDAAAGPGEAWSAGVARQEADAEWLAALEAERTRFRATLAPGLHRNVAAAAERRFYVQPLGETGAFRVLAVDPAALRAFLAECGERSREVAEPGIDPEVVEGPAARLSAPAFDLEAAPGWSARARLEPGAAGVTAGGREAFYWWIIACSIVGIVAGGFLTARVVMREVRLAKIKAGFVSTVSHELKTPLTSIRMFAEMLGSGKVTDAAEQRECLDVITAETERLGRLIQQVLDFGRLQAQQRRFQWVRTTLAPVVEREAERFRRATGLSPEEFRVEIAINQPAVVHDPEAMAEVITNLLSNAWKYSPAAGRRILLTLGPSRGRLVLAVEDNGPGVPARERTRIFEQFYRVDDLLTREVEGTGLGLSIAQSIVRAHGGRIRVEDGEEGGSRFVVDLPRATGTAERPAAGTKEVRG